MKISFSFSLLFPPPIQLRSSLSISLALSFFFLLLFILALPICHFKKYPSRGIQTNHTLTMPLVLGAYISPTRPHGTLTESNNTLGSQPCAWEDQWGGMGWDRGVTSNAFTQLTTELERVIKTMVLSFSHPHCVLCCWVQRCSSGMESHAPGSLEIQQEFVGPDKVSVREKER